MSDNEVLYQSAGGRVRNIPNEPSFSERAGPNERVAARIAHWMGPMTDSRHELPNGRDQ